MKQNQHRDASAQETSRAHPDHPAGQAPSWPTERQELLDQVREANEQLVCSAIQAQEGHEAANLRFRELVEGLDAIVWEADADTGQFTFVSQQAQTILGYPASRWIEERDFWITLIHPEDREQTLKSWKASLEARQDYQVEFRAIAADGRAIWVALRARLKSAMSHPVRVLGFMVDIGERRRTEKRLQQSVTDYQVTEDKLREKIEELENFMEVVVGRELKMIQLEKEVDQLKSEVKSLRAERK